MEQQDPVGAVRVTIGMPVYNSADMIADAIESVQNQAFDRWRLVIADNASTDDTAAIAARFASADSRITVIEQPRNLGQAGNFEAVFNGTTTEFFMWLSGDDMLASDYLSGCIDALDAEPELIGVFTDAEGIDEDGRSMGRFLERSGVGRDVADRPTRFLAAVHATVGFAMFGLYRTEALARSPRLEPYVGSDRVLAGALALIGPIRELPQVSFSRRVHAGQYSRAVNSNRHRYLSYAGRPAPRFRPLWPTRIITLARIVWSHPAPLAERIRMERTVFGSFTWRILKGEVTMVIRTAAKLLGRVTGRKYDVMEWHMNRGEIFDSAK